MGRHGRPGTHHTVLGGAGGEAQAGQRHLRRVRNALAGSHEEVLRELGVIDYTAGPVAAAVQVGARVIGPAAGLPRVVLTVHETRAGVRSVARSRRPEPRPGRRHAAQTGSTHRFGSPNWSPMTATASMPTQKRMKKTRQSESVHFRFIPATSTSQTSSSASTLELPQQRQQRGRALPMAQTVS